jgi:DNA-binding response OmpR family regulator
MRLLIAEDDRATSHLLTRLADSWGYEAVTLGDGVEALAEITGETPPDLALLDWGLPGLDGPEICRRFRAHPRGRDAQTYVVLLTSRSDRADVVAGLDAGADDYLTKPFNPSELSARLRVGARMVELQQSLTANVRKLEQALTNVRQLKGLLPICAYCKSIRDDSDYWHRVEHYLSEHSGLEFSHGICPNCLERLEREAAGG